MLIYTINIYIAELLKIYERRKNNFISRQFYT